MIDTKACPSCGLSPAVAAELRQMQSQRLSWDAVRALINPRRHTQQAIEAYLTSRGWVRRQTTRLTQTWFLITNAGGSKVILPTSASDDWTSAMADLVTLCGSIDDQGELGVLASIAAYARHERA